MLKLNLPEVSRDEVHLREDVPADHPMWSELDLALKGPLRVDVTARSVGTGVFVRGRISGRLVVPCRRCLEETELEMDEPVDLLFQELEDEEDADGEVYPLPARGTEVDLTEPVREQVLLRVPKYVVCREECRGLCAQCGTNLNDESCDCVPEEKGTPWDALKNVKFD